MVKIRLARSGAKKRPFYHIVVTDNRKRRDGGYIERLGYFNPVATGQELRLKVDAERVAHWVKTGALVSERVNHLMKEVATEGEEGAVKARAKFEPQRAARMGDQSKEKPAPAPAEEAKPEEAEETEAKGDSGESTEAAEESKGEEAKGEATAEEAKADEGAEAKSEEAEESKSEADAGEATEDSDKDEAKS